MQNMEHKTPLANNHISVDCVVIGFDGEQLKVLLIKRVGEEQGEIFHDMKLPGSLIYMDEDLDEAAQRVLNELTGLKNVNLMQFKAFGSKNRTKDPKDIHWLERAMESKVEPRAEYQVIFSFMRSILQALVNVLERREDSCFTRVVFLVVVVCLWVKTGNT